MYCPNCNKEYEGKFCPECGTKLIEKPASQGGLSVNLGDGNAISGGIHHQDSHAVTNVDNSLHNITTNSSTVNNITNVASQKTEMEFLQEKKTLYLNACKRAYEDNVLELAEVNALEEERLKLGLDKATADRILNQVRLMSERNARKSELNPIAKVKLRKLTENLQKNEVKALMQQIDSLEPLVNKYDHDELQRKYYLVLAALKSEKCIASYENTQTDNYWNTFWSYLAYIKDGNIVEAENLLESLDRFTSYPEDNMTVLAAAGALMTGRTKEAREYLNAAKGEYTPALQRFVDSLNLLLVPQKAKKTGADENTCAFYLVNFFGQKDPKVKAEEERLKREAAEAERRRKEIEEQKRKEEEARKKTEEEWRKKKAEAAERRRIEAEKKKLEEERKKAEAIEKRKATIEAKKKAEAERLNKIREERLKKEAEEADRKTKEEAIRKAKEAEEAKRRAEEEARRNAEEAERKRLEAERKVEVEAKRMEEEARKRQENIRNYGLVSLVFLIPFVWGLFVNSDYSLLLNVFVSLFAAIPFGVAVFSVVGSLSNWSDNSFENFCILFGIFLGISIFVGTLVLMPYQDTFKTIYAQISFSLFFADIMWFWVLRDPKESFWVMVISFALLVSIILWLKLTH